MKLDLNDERQKAQAVSLSFHPTNADSEPYIALEKAIPKTRGITRKLIRMWYIFDIVQNLDELGYKIVNTKEAEKNFKDVLRKIVEQHPEKFKIKPL